MKRNSLVLRYTEKSLMIISHLQDDPLNKMMTESQANNGHHECQDKPVSMRIINNFTVSLSTDLNKITHIGATVLFCFVFSHYLKNNSFPSLMEQLQQSQPGCLFKM